MMESYSMYRGGQEEMHSLLAGAQPSAAYLSYQDSCTPVTNPNFGSNGASMEISCPSWSEASPTCSVHDAYDGAFLPTPPRKGTPSLPPYPFSCPVYSTTDVSAIEYLQGTSLDESSQTSPHASQDNIHNPAEMMPFLGTGRPVMTRSTSPLVQFHIAQQGSYEYLPMEEQKPIPEGVKLPQRKGGMQLWQFLYALLTDPECRYHELIEWTVNRKEREFRLLQPEAIAIWWGHHKNKANMSYDKLSRSLRYYYDKGLIRKIPGERYVYRFCIDPERMYKHIGNSECRPKLKPIPQSAKMAISKFQNEQSIEVSSNSAFVAQAPETLPIPASTSALQVDSLKVITQRDTAVTYSYPLPVTTSAEGPIFSQAGNLSMRRCVSLDTNFRGVSTWTNMPQHFSSMSSLSPNMYGDAQTVPDNGFYTASPLSCSPYDSPLQSCSPASPDNYLHSVSEAATFELTQFSSHSYSSSSSVQDSPYSSADTASFYLPTTSDMSMWTFAQE